MPKCGDGRVAIGAQIGMQSPNECAVEFLDPRIASLAAVQFPRLSRAVVRDAAWDSEAALPAGRGTCWVLKVSKLVE